MSYHLEASNAAHHFKCAKSTCNADTWRKQLTEGIECLKVSLSLAEKALANGEYLGE